MARLSGLLSVACLCVLGVSRCMSEGPTSPRPARNGTALYDFDLTHDPEFVRKMSRMGVMENRKRTVGGFPFKIKNLVVEDCGSESDPVKVNDLQITPEMKISGSASIKVPVCAPGEAVALDITVSKKLTSFLSFYTKIPCVHKYFGSCSFPDMCNAIPEAFKFAPDNCPEPLKSLSLPCGFPVPVGEYKADFQVPTPPVDMKIPVPSFLIKGDFKAQIVAKKDGVQKSCHTASFTLA